MPGLRGPPETPPDCLRAPPSLSVHGAPIRKCWVSSHHVQLLCGLKWMVRVRSPNCINVDSKKRNGLPG